MSGVARDVPGEPRRVIGVYVASKSALGPFWKAFQPQWSKVGIEITSTWIDESGPGETDDMVDLWVRCVDEARCCDALVAYHCKGDVWKGAFVEIGAALAWGRPVFVVGDPPGSWVNHPNVRRLAHLDLLPGALAEAGGPNVISLPGSGSTP